MDRGRGGARRKDPLKVGKPTTSSNGSHAVAGFFHMEVFALPAAAARTFFFAASSKQFPTIEPAAGFTGRPRRVAPGVQGLQASSLRFQPEQVIGCEAKQRLS